MTVTLLLALASSGALIGYYYRAPAVPSEKLDRIQPGMTMQDVADLLGYPQYEETLSMSETTRWVYGSRLRKRILEVSFTRAGKVRHVYHGY